MKMSLLGGQHKGFSKNQDTQETVNMFLEADPSEQENSAVLIRIDGKKQLVELPDTPVYAMSEYRNTLYVVAGASIFAVAFDFSYTLIGTADLGEMTTIAANNAGQICFNSGSTLKAYVYETLTGTLTQVTSAAFYGSPRVDYLDGYGVFIRPNTQQFYISALNDFKTFDGLDFASDEADPDNLVSHIVDHRELILFGERVSTVWFNSGSPDFPLSRREGADMEVGLAAALSVSKLDNTVFFLGRNAYGHGIVYKLNQYTPQIISNRGIEHMIGGFERIDDAFAYTYQKNGHSFYVLTFPEAGKTLVYDASIGDPDAAWHIRETYSFGRDRSSCYAFAFCRHLVGDYASGIIYEMDSDTHLDGNLPICWSRTTAHIINDYKRLRHNQVVLNFERGVGLEDGTDPLCFLTYSDDGGHTYVTPRQQSMGVIGRREPRVNFARLGQSRDRVYKIFGSEPVKTVLINGYLNVEAQSG